ncbi:MAG: histidine triad nucleotide-binding protein [Clostridia bacterium]|nr:histidine triad nucleotide-binding protein [Clostridia bacterium]
MDNCIFCKIIKKEIPSTIVYEDDRIIAFNDIQPETPVHVLIIPKIHISSANELNKDNVSYIADIHLAAPKIAEKLGIAQSGYRLINNCGSDAGQTVFHIHFHLVGGRKMGTKIL